MEYLTLNRMALFARTKGAKDKKERKKRRSILGKSIVDASPVVLTGGLTGVGLQAAKNFKEKGVPRLTKARYVVTRPSNLLKLSDESLKDIQSEMMKQGHRKEIGKKLKQLVSDPKTLAKQEIKKTAGTVSEAIAKNYPKRLRQQFFKALDLKNLKRDMIKGLPKAGIIGTGIGASALPINYLRNKMRFSEKGKERQINKARKRYEKKKAYIESFN